MKLRTAISAIALTAAGAGAAFADCDAVSMSDVGSQTRRAQMWAPVLDQVAAIWHAARDAGHEMSLLNIGGGFPAFYGEAIDAPTCYAADVMTLVHERFGDVPEVMAEPGRGLVAEAGAIAAEVLLVGRVSGTVVARRLR